MPPPLPSSHRGMTANPLKPVQRYRPGKPIAEEPSSEEEEGEDEGEAEEQMQREQDRRTQEQARKRQEQLQRQRQQAPKASSFPAAAAAGKITRGVRDVSIEEKVKDDEEGFVTEEEEDELAEVSMKQRRPATQVRSAAMGGEKEGEDEDEYEEEEEEQEEESSEEESSSEDEAPRRVLLRPTFIKRDQRGNANQITTAATAVAPAADSAADAEARRAQRQEKADMLVREQLEKEAIARSAANRAWDDDEMVEVGEEAAIDDTDGLDPEAEYAAWKLRELRRIKREREAIEVAEKEREEIERRRNLTAEEREREDREFIEKQKEEKEASRGQTGYMQRYFHKGAFFRDDLEREGLDKRNVMGHKFADDVSRETLPQYMQIRDMTKLGKKGRTRYKDLRNEDTGRFGDGLGYRSGSHRDRAPPVGITDERFLPDQRGDDQGAKGPTGANASVVRERRRYSRSRSPRRRRSRSRGYSPPRRGRDERRDRHRDRESDRSYDRHRPDSGMRRKRSPSPYDDRDKRRRVQSDVSR